MSPPGTDPATPPPESPHPKTRPGGTKKGKSLRRLEGEGRRDRVSVIAVLEVGLGGQGSRLDRSLQRGHFLTTASGAGDAKTRHWRRAGPLKKAGAECRAVTIGGAGLEIVD